MAPIKAPASRSCTSCATGDASLHRDATPAVATVSDELQWSRFEDHLGDVLITFNNVDLSALINHLEQTHHAFLREELPRLTALIGKVAYKHGAREPRLRQVVSLFLGFSAELSSHIRKEERTLFPKIRQLEASDEPPEFLCGSLAIPIREMTYEHEAAKDALREMRALTDGLTAPPWACAAYHALVDSLAYLHRDMRVHVLIEDCMLFPRALELEAHKSGRAPLI